MTIIHGNYNDQNIIPILVDATGKPIVVLGAGSEAIGSVGVTSMPVVEVTSKGGDKIFGIESVIQAYYSNSSLPAGSTYLTGATVPVNKYWHITMVGMMYYGTVAGVDIRSMFTRDTTDFTFQHITPPVSGLYYTNNINVVLIAGEYIRARVVGATLGDQFRLFYLGYQMDVT